MRAIVLGVLGLICAGASAAAQDPREREWDRLAEEQAKAIEAALAKGEVDRDPFRLASIQTKYATNPMLERMEVRARATFRGVDLDQDGETSAGELSAERRRSFRGIDKNGDRTLTIGEFMGYYGRLAKDRITDYFWQGDVQKEFFRLDEDLDERLSEPEWLAPAQWFVARYDLDRDDAVTEDEYVRELLPNTRKPR